MKNLFLISFILFLSGCSILEQKVDGKTAQEWKIAYQESENKWQGLNEKYTTLEKELDVVNVNLKALSNKEEKRTSKEYIFKKNKECFNLRNGIEKRKPSYTIIKVFYSPLIESCVYHSELSGENGSVSQLKDAFNVSSQNSNVNPKNPISLSSVYAVSRISCEGVTLKFWEDTI